MWYEIEKVLWVLAAGAAALLGYAVGGPVGALIFLIWAGVAAAAWSQGKDNDDTVEISLGEIQLRLSREYRAFGILLARMEHYEGRMQRLERLVERSFVEAPRSKKGRRARKEKPQPRGRGLRSWQDILDATD